MKKCPHSCGCPHSCASTYTFFRTEREALFSISAWSDPKYLKLHYLDLICIPLTLLGGRNVIQALLQPKWDHIFFTGSVVGWDSNQRVEIFVSKSTFYFFSKKWDGVDDFGQDLISVYIIYIVIPPISTLEERFTRPQQRI